MASTFSGGLFYLAPIQSRHLNFNLIMSTIVVAVFNCSCDFRCSFL